MSIRSKILLFAAFFIAFFSIEAALFHFLQTRMDAIVGAHIAALDSETAKDLMSHMDALKSEGQMRMLFVYAALFSAARSPPTRLSGT